MIAGAACLLALGAYGLWSVAAVKTVSDFERAQLEVERLRDDRRELTRELRASRKEVEELKGQLVYTERSTEIETQSCEVVQASLADLQSEVADLREQVAFYRGIVSPELSKAGVRVYDVGVRALQASNTYRYELVLIQSVRHERRVGGRVRMVLEGTRNGQRESLPMEQLEVGTKSDAQFAFKYFEEFSADFQLPAGFKPVSLKIVLSTQSDNAQDIQQDFEWARILKP